MSVDLSKQLRELQTSTDDLNALTDRANEIVRRVEVFLNEKCRVGGEMSIHVPSLDEDDTENGIEWSTYLEYQRHKGEYRLLVTHLVNGDSNETKPWAECSRSIKIATLGALPTLIGKLHEMVRGQITEAQTKIDYLDDVLAAVGESQNRRTSVKKT